jgi:beta-glucanase (GH16 family)
LNGRTGARSHSSRHGNSGPDGKTKRGGYRMRWWKLLLGVIIVSAVAVWGLGPGGHSSTDGTAPPPRPVPTPAASSTADVPVATGVPGVLKPKANPEFSATFTGSTLDTSLWSTCYPGFDQSGCTNFGNPYTEREWYLPSQVVVSGGLLHLVAQQAPTPGKTASGSATTYACRSGMVTTYPAFQFEYGYIQVVARIPTSAGLWPALWLAASDLKWPPEMDLLETWGGSKLIASTWFHYTTPSGNGQVQGPITPAIRAAGWHTFALSWTRSQMTWLLDGRVIMTVRQHVPHQKMYFLADLAEWITRSRPNVTASECNGSLLISSVKVWKA